MKIALIGATGMVGQRILNEALGRGHVVTAIVRDTSKLPQNENLIASQGDVFDETALAALIEGHEAVISSFNPGWGADNIGSKHLEGSRSILHATKRANVKRLLEVGGAGSLEIAPGVQLVDTPDFPGSYKDAALGARAALDELRQEQDVEWTFFSPSIEIKPGERTGTFRVGGDQVLFDSEGKSHISAEDFAVALVDELEKPQHIRQRVTVGY